MPISAWQRSTSADRSGSGRPLAGVGRSLGREERRGEPRLGFGRIAAEGDPVGRARPTAVGSPPAATRAAKPSAQCRARPLLSIARAWGAVVVVLRWPMLTRCSGQSKSIIIGMSWLRLMKK